jgi:hypothetical protein
MKKTIKLIALIPTICFGQWTQFGNSINGQMAGENCGWSTAISADGTIVAMGAIFNNGATGQVRVFGESNGVWTQIGGDLNGETGGDQTGQSVSLSSDGTVVAIGEPFNNDLGFTSGQVRVFKNIANTWTQVGQDLYGANAIAEAGTSVDLSANGAVVAFGIPNEKVNGISFTGKVKVFEQQGNIWVQKGGDIDGDGTIIKFGESVSISDDGNIVAIGQTGDPGNLNAPQIGRVMVYQFSNNQWTQLGSTIFGQVDRDEFGIRVSLSSTGNILAISSPASNVVVIYQLNSGVWTQIGDAILGENTGDQFGSSISLSNDGSILAAGARWYNKDGFRRGRAYVYKNQGGNWTLINNSIAGVADNDQFGFSIATSANGSRVSVGAISNDSSGNNAGQLRVFENSIALSSIISDNQSFLLYPNPVKDIAKIECNKDIQSYAIFSIDGKLIQSVENINTTNYIIDFNNINVGIYILQLVTDHTIKSIKLIKE